MSKYIPVVPAQFQYEPVSVVGGVCSDARQTTSGVPQGSILGPLLFVIHINDLPRSIQNSSVLMYADDTVIFCAGSDSKSIEDKINLDLSTLGDWLRVNSLFLNTKKNESMLFGTHSKLAKNKDFLKCILLQSTLGACK